MSLKAFSMHVRVWLITVIKTVSVCSACWISARFQNVHETGHAVSHMVRGHEDTSVLLSLGSGVSLGSLLF